MTLVYSCRHCNCVIGELKEISLHSMKLGFHLLTYNERQEMINYDKNGNINVKSICEDCHESFMKNPLLHQTDHIIH